MKQYTNLAVVEGTSYSNLVSMVKRWESSQTKINNMYQLGSASSGHDTSGRMEVDMVKDKGGKKKFTKGKGVSDKGNGGKGNTKFDGQQKGKQGKGQMHFGKGKGNYSNANANAVSSDACLYSGKRGHWKRDCHQRQRDQANKVQCVEDASQAPVASVSQHATPSANSIPSPQQVQQLPQHRAPLHQPHSMDDGCDWCDLTIYELESDPEIDISYTRMVQFSGHGGHGNACEFFDIDVYCGGDPALQDCAATASERLHWNQEESWWFSDDAIGQICMVSSEGKAAFDTDIIIDSGADVSVLPLSMSACGPHTPHKQERYVDAQGKPMRITQRSICDVYLPGLNGDVLLREEFVVAPVSRPLLSAGKLMRAGWRIGDRDGQPQERQNNCESFIQAAFILCYR